jgi:hypothetical protein
MDANVGDSFGERTETMSLRLPVDLAQFVERQAIEMCNSRNGIVRLALVKFREAVEGQNVQFGGEETEPEPVFSRQ